MISKIAPVALLAGVATAGCPLSVDITNTTGHIAEVAVTNTGSETVTFFKGNTVLSSHATKDLLVADADDKDLPFQGLYVNYKKTGIPSDMFQTLAPGESVKTTVNAAKTYNLEGVSQAKVTVVQGFRYVTGATAPTSLSETETCEDVTSAPVTVTPDQATVVEDRLVSKRSTPRSRIEARSITYSSCSSSQTSQLKTSVNDAISMANAAYTAAGNGADYFTTWFKSTSVKSKVQSIYKSVAGVQTTSPKISCTDIYGDCRDGSALLYTSPDDNVIVPCPNNGFWDFPEFASQCSGDDYDRAGSVLHEMTHLYGTQDYAYGPDAAKRLSASQAAANADTYEMYSESVRLGGCTTG